MKKVKCKNKTGVGRGGKRNGAGRKPMAYETKILTFRVRTEFVDIVKGVVKKTIDSCYSILPKEKKD